MPIEKNYDYIYNSIKSLSNKTTLIVVTKNQQLELIKLLINKKHLDFGENRVQDAILKWKILTLNNPQLKIHLIGKLQSNKAKEAFEIFHYIHTLDNEKLAQINSNSTLSAGDKQKQIQELDICYETCLRYRLLAVIAKNFRPSLFYI